MQKASIGELFVGVFALISGIVVLSMVLWDIAPTDKFSDTVGMSRSQQRGRWLLIGIGSLVLGLVIILHGARVL